MVSEALLYEEGLALYSIAMFFALLFLVSFIFVLPMLSVALIEPSGT